MAEVAWSELWDSEGNLIWKGSIREDKTFMNLIEDKLAAETLRALYFQDSSEKTCTKADVVKAAEDLEFISRTGCLPGFFNILPPATFLDACVDSFNLSPLEVLGANRIDFPLVYDAKPEDMQALTNSYETQGRVFKLNEAEHEMRLAYAADPGLFSFFRDKVLKTDNLPYAIYSPISAFRRWQSGEIGGFAKLRQYTVPDLHIIAEKDGVLEVYLECINQAALGARFWFGEEWLPFYDIEENFLAQNSDICSKFAKMGKKLTLINILKKRPRYYAVKTGVMVSAGFGALMLYNLQWDDTNPTRFNLQADNGKDLVIIHATVAGGWAKLLPMFLGRGLTGIGPKMIPVELAARQVSVVPINESHSDTAKMIIEKLNAAGVRAVLEISSKSMPRRIKKLRRQWQGFYCIIGDKEKEGADPVIENFAQLPSMSILEFIAFYGDRIKRCNNHTGLIPKTIPIMP